MFGLCVEEFARSIAKCLRYIIMQDVSHVCSHISKASLIENILDGKVKSTYLLDQGYELIYICFYC